MSLKKIPQIEKVKYERIERHLNRIREKLWEGQEYGRVSVLVGAGFSRNAKKRSSHTPTKSQHPALNRNV